MNRQIFVNLPVTDLQKSIDFFTRLGFEFNPKFTDENATCMVIGDDSYVMLLAKEFFASFTTKDVIDAAAHTEAIVALSAESRAGVDELVDQALAAGGQPSKEAMDQGGMYGRSFQDLDGHIWEVIWMDPTTVQG